MAGVNKVIILGHLGNDPEMRYLNDETGYTDNLTGRAYDRWDAWLARAVQNQE